MSDADNSPSGRLLRLTPRRAPFRRGGVAFPTLDAITMTREEAEDTIDDIQMRQLASEPLVDVDLSDDDGKTWARFEAPAEPETRSRRKR